MSPRPEVAAAHLAVMAEEARLLASASEARPNGSAVLNRRGARRKVLRTMRRVAVSLAVATTAAMVSMVGLAYAGVNLPSAAVTAFDKLGITLPNQAGDHGTGGPSDASQHGKDVSETAKAGESEGPGSGDTSSEEGDDQGQSPGSGKDDHPTGSSEEGTSTNPTGNGKDSHPSDKESGQGTNPTGYGKDNHPSDGESGQSTNPTGYGKDNHPGGQ